MKITSVDSKIYSPSERIPFKVALAANPSNSVVLIRVNTDAGITGIGEAAPYAPVTGNDTASTAAAVRALADAITGMDPLCPEQIHARMDGLFAGQSAAKAGIDIAIHDIIGKKTGLPLYQLLGGNGNTAESDMTIGIDEPAAMAERARAYVDEGFRILKIKTGLDPDEDIEAIRLIREAVGPEVDIRLDANQGWDAKETIRVMKELEKYDVSEVEQPVKYWDLDGCRRIRDNISQELMLDESVHSPRDAMRAVREEATDYINIKLMKSSGLYPAVKINAIAEAAGIPCMVGCMNETRIGIAAAAALVASKSNIRLADLDGYKFLEESPFIRGGFTQEGGTIRLTDRPGLGIEVDYDRL